MAVAAVQYRATIHDAERIRSSVPKGNAFELDGLSGRWLLVDVDDAIEIIGDELIRVIPEPARGLKDFTATPARSEVTTSDMINAAFRTLHRLGYNWHGGVEWKPPLGSDPDFKPQPMTRFEVDELMDGMQQLIDAQGTVIDRLMTAIHKLRSGRGD